MVQMDGPGLSHAVAGYCSRSGSGGRERGHKPTPSQESNTLSEVSCFTTLSAGSDWASGDTGGRDRTSVGDCGGRALSIVGLTTGSVDSLATLTGATVTRGGSIISSEGSGAMERIISLKGSTHSDRDTETENQRNKGLSFRRNIQMNLDIEKCDNSLDSSNVSEDPATPLLLEPDRSRDKRQSPRMPESCPPQPPDLTQSLEMLDEESETIEEPVKTFLSFLWLWSGFFATSTSLALTHEKVPDTAPLPDLVLDNIRYQRLGLDLSEVLLVVNSLLGAVVVFSHVHRLVILRRVWLLLGILYYYRAITMFVTVLPKPDESYICAAKVDDITPYDVTRRVITLLSGGGLSINGKHIYCGDYIFSGHTMTLTMAYLTIKQYSPRRFVLLHWASAIISLTGITGLVLARGHYSIDVLLAYFVTSRLWWIYHAMATNTSLKHRAEDNFLARAWWYWIFYYFERNVPCDLPRRYAISAPSVVSRGWGCLRRGWAQGCRCKTDEGELIEEARGDKEAQGRDVV